MANISDEQRFGFRANVKAQKRVENLRRENAGWIGRGLTLPSKSMHTELWEEGAYDDRGTWLLNARELESGRGGNREARTMRHPFKLGLGELHADKEAMARKQEKRRWVDESQSYFDVNNAVPGLNDASNYGRADTVPILIGRLEHPGQIEIPDWAIGDEVV